MHESWKDIIGSVSPIFATALGGPLAGIAVKAISTAILDREDGSEKDIASAIKTGGIDIIDKIKHAGDEFEKKMVTSQIDLEDIAFKDRANAREREEKTNDSMPKYLAIMVVIGFFVTVAVVLVGWSKADSALAGTLIGFIAAEMKQVISYYFGSSAGSAKKNDMMVKLTQK